MKAVSTLMLSCSSGRAPVDVLVWLVMEDHLAHPAEIDVVVHHVRGGVRIRARVHQSNRDEVIVQAQAQPKLPSIASASVTRHTDYRAP